MSRTFIICKLRKDLIEQELQVPITRANQTEYLCGIRERNGTWWGKQFKIEYRGGWFSADSTNFDCATYTIKE